MEALFERDGARFVPTAATTGPWGDDLMHGGPVSALCTELLEEAGGPEYESVRVSMDFIRPLIQRPFTVDCRVVREGRRLQLLEAELRVETTAVARCSVVRIRPMPVDVPAQDDRQAPPDTPEEFFVAEGFRVEGTFFAGAGIEMRVPTAGEFAGGTAWYRLMLPVLAGRTPSPMARAAAAADFGNGISGFREWPPRVAFPNADLVVHLDRSPEGEWVRLESRSTWRPDGIGLARSQLADRTGPVGVAEQSLVLSPAK